MYIWEIINELIFTYNTFFSSSFKCSEFFTSTNDPQSDVKHDRPRSTRSVTNWDTPYFTSRTCAWKCNRIHFPAKSHTHDQPRFTRSVTFCFEYVQVNRAIPILRAGLVHEHAIKYNTISSQRSSTWPAQIYKVSYILFLIYTNQPGTQHFTSRLCANFNFQSSIIYSRTCKSIFKNQSFSTAYKIYTIVFLHLWRD